MTAAHPRVRILGSLALTTLWLAAPAAAASLRPIRFDHLSLEEGLSQSTVMGIVQDQRGYIWLATEDGLNRFDGVSFKVYRHDPADTASLPSSFVWGVEEDASGDLWVATSDGLARWQRATDRVVREEKLAGRHIRALRFDPKKKALWIGTRDTGLLRLDVTSGELRHYAHDAADSGSLSDDRIYAIYLDGQSRLWVGTDGGLNLLGDDGKRFEHFIQNPAEPSSLSDPKVRAILEDDRGALWVGTSTGGLNRLNAATRRFDHFRHDPNTLGSLAHDQVRAILQDADHRLWVGTGQGLDLFEPSRQAFAHYRHDPTNPSSLADEHVLALAQDRGGVLWVGTRLGGVHKWNPLSWQFGHVAPDAENPTGLGSGHVTSFSEDRTGRLWIGTFDAGLYVMERTTGEMAPYRHDAKNERSLGSDQVMVLRHDHLGNLWIGTLDAGLNRFDAASGQFKRYRSDPKQPEGLSANGVTSILEDREGKLWLGTYGGGLEQFEPESARFTHFRFDARNAASLSGDRVSSLAESADGHLWIGTMEKGLNLLDTRTGRFQRFGHRAGDSGSLASDAVHTLFVDAAGGLWVGTHGGLSHLPPEGTSFQTFTTRNGLPSDVVYGVRSDQQGRLWLSTNNGLSCFDPRSGQVTNYDVSDGLQSTEFNFGAWHQSPSGELFFGGLNGFNVFRPDRLRRTAVAPPVVLTSVSVGHKPVAGPADETRRLNLGFRDKVVGFEFAALDFSAPHRNRFAYKLEGFDPDWVPLNGRRSVTYTNLNPGHYSFRLRAANRDGRWNEDGLAVGIDVAAAPWATRWAFTGYFLLLGGSVLGLVRIQQRKLDREAEYAHMLEVRVEERTRELSERQLELERVNHNLAQASITDSLTGLANRRFLTEYLEKEVALLHRRYRRLSEETPPVELLDLAFLMIDLDHFKTINDSVGHAAGDAVLRQMRELLESVSRSSDIIVRWGGDEFLLVARELSGDGLAELAERIRHRLAQHAFDVGEGRVVRTSCSVGFACYPFFKEQLDALSWEQVISVADRALYVAKASGRNSWVGFHPGIAALPIQSLFSSICHGTQQLVRDGALRVSSSLTGLRNLVWETPARETANG
ncbi:MAG TPA: two-component regulator propeller domain-containing protein [Vicinamibacteria bacterium]|jgi:diguanylate cyclase (GGDEF)-like protein|nr:two-component regulator propeller domain-containing protein [Vicinamibacteria bacterium]